MQWCSFTAELTAVVVLWLRGRALGFCRGDFLESGIPRFHFGDLVHPLRADGGNLLAGVCSPLERLGPWLRRVKARRGERTGWRSARHPMPVLRDHAVDGGG